MNSFEFSDFLYQTESAYEKHCALYHSCMRHNDRDGERYHRGRADSLEQVLDFLRSCVDAAEA